MPDGPQSVGDESRLLRGFLNLLSCALVSPDVLAEKLWTKKVITPSVYQAAVSPRKPGRERSQELLEEVCDRVFYKSVSLKDLLETLRELPEVGRLPDAIASIQEEYGKINANHLAKQKVCLITLELVCIVAVCILYSVSQARIQ